MVIVAVPAEEVGVVTMLQDELLAPEVGVMEADPGPALYADGVHSVHKAAVLEVVAVPEDLQLPPCEVLALVERDLEGRRELGVRLLSFQIWGLLSGLQHPLRNPDSQATKVLPGCAREVPGTSADWAEGEWPRGCCQTGPLPGSRQHCSSSLGTGMPPCPSANLLFTNFHHIC